MYQTKNKKGITIKMNKNATISAGTAFSDSSKNFGRPIAIYIGPGPSGFPYFSQLARANSFVRASYAFVICKNFAAAGRGLSLFLSGCHFKESLLKAFLMSEVSALLSISRISNGSNY